jgi:two-component system copper resistance phosphate regulon response regulator CusR
LLGNSDFPGFQDGKAMKILIVEDDEKTAAYIRKGLAEKGYAVDVAIDGEEGLRILRGGVHDLAIVDVMLPGRDGWNLVKTLRDEGHPVPVLFLTARDSVDDRVKGLNLGADDYLVKPFAFSELLARARSILRRSASWVPDTVSIADLEINLPQHKAQRGGTRLDLTPKEFNLLALLARRSGEVLTRTFIAEKVWDINFDCDSNVVDVHIRRLRKKVDEPFVRGLIHTVRGVGYVLEDRS